MFYIKIYFCIYVISWIINIAMAFYTMIFRPDVVQYNLDIDKVNRYKFGSKNIDDFNIVIVWIFPYILTAVIILGIIKKRIDYKI